MIECTTTRYYKGPDWLKNPDVQATGNIEKARQASLYKKFRTNAEKQAAAEMSLPKAREAKTLRKFKPLPHCLFLVLVLHFCSQSFFRSSAAFCSSFE
jgi:hypothetical protein